MFEESIYTVSEITGEIKSILESEFSVVKVEGEISNFKAHVSGHWYFTLKDSNAAISCAMWRSVNNSVFFTPEDGMKVILKGRITVYPPRGSYQIDVRSMQPAGEGELQAAFDRLKRRLSEEGLFDERHKKPIPRLPRKIGIVTAIGGAAFQDMINTAKRRFPLAELVIAPAQVQGKDAALSIARSINILNKQGDIDVIIAGRGGGSLEDLWAFNEEVVARAIFNSAVPVISGVGHEVDFTISDFAADLRAATPTAAMELATPDKEDFLYFFNDFIRNSHELVFNLIERGMSQVEHTVAGYGFRSPGDLVMNKSQFLDNLWYRIEKKLETKFVFEKNRLELFGSKLESSNSEKILKKGYTITKQEDKIIPRLEKLNSKKSFSIKFFDGEIKVN